MSRYARTLLSASLQAALVLGVLGACTLGGPKVDTRTYQTPDGVVVVQTTKMVATVQAVDARSRKVTLKAKWREPVTFKADKRVANFNQIRVGDEVHAEVIEEFAVTLIPGGTEPAVMTADSVALAPLGDKPGVIIVDTVVVTADIVAIDAHDHSITLEFPDGSTKTVQLARNRDLADLALGDSVAIQVSEGVAIAVVTPKKD